MAQTPTLSIYNVPRGIPINEDFIIKTRLVDNSHDQSWFKVPAVATRVANASTIFNTFNEHTVGIASFDFHGTVEVSVQYTAGRVEKAIVRPTSLGIKAVLAPSSIIFTLDKPRDVMVEINGDKWKALHLLTNEIDADAPNGDTNNVWYFGPGINQGSAYSKVADGVNLAVPSGKTVYLAGGAYITCRLNFIGVSNSSVRGPGFILGPKGGFVQREWGGAIHMSGATDILVKKVTSLGANGFSLSAGECKRIHVDGYRSFSFAGNGDGIDFFCSSDIVIENCFLRNSDDTIALYSHRWDWYGDSNNITIRNCVLLPDIAHAINMGTHGNPTKPEVTTNVTVKNIDVLDHEENQVWYQGCIAINVADESIFDGISFENVRVERITRGQLINIRVMQNAMWTTAPGGAIRNVSFRNVSLNMDESKVVNPSQILGYDGSRQVENIVFESLKIGNRMVYEGMEKPRWYMVSDLVPLFANEHVKNLRFI